MAIHFQMLKHVSVYRQNGDAETAFTVPEAALYELDMVIDVLEDIAAAHRRDLDECGGFDIKALTHESINFRRRSIGRLGAFVTYACNIDGLLRAVYREVEKIRERFKFPPTSLPFRESMMAYPPPFGEWRNKVFAHTAFASPRPDDNASDRHTSIMLLSGSTCTVLPNGDVRHGGGERRSDGARPNTPIPQLGIIEAHGIMSERLNDWYNAMVFAVVDLAERPLSEWQSADPSITRVTASVYQGVPTVVTR